MSLYQKGLLGFAFHKLIFQYVPKTEDAGAALNFHLTTQEKLNIAALRWAMRRIRILMQSLGSWGVKEVSNLK